MPKGDIVESIFGWIGLVISTYFYFSLVVPYVKVLKGEMKYTDSPKMALLCNIVNCILWIDYGLIKDSLQLYLTCAIGGCLTLIWSSIYLIFLAKKNFVLGFIYCISVIAFILGLLFLFYSIDVEITGYSALIFNILMFFAPGEKIYTVIKTGNYELIPIFSTIGTLLCAGCWLIYGIYQVDLNLIIPNILGLLFGFLQMFIYCIYKNKQINIKDEEGDNIVNLAV